MIERVHRFDWATTSLGPMKTWPRHLRTAVDICLHSRFPMVIFWGNDLTIVYNDAWAQIIGTKHPGALGSRGADIFPEVWGTLAPLFRTVLETGKATWSDDQLLPMQRSPHVDIEECYFTWSYSAILDDEGAVAGIFTAVSETTDRVLGERRLETLRSLSARAAEARTVAAACKGAAGALADNDADIAFALLYLLDADNVSARLVEQVRLDPGAPFAPLLVDPASDSPWPVQEVITSGVPEHLTDLAARFGDLPGGRWPVPANEALVLPLTFAGQDDRGGAAVIGLSPYLYLNDAYRSFLELAVSHTVTGISNALAYESERRRAEALVELDRAKSIFFSNVSHELRTPLTLILGPLEDLLQTPERAIEAPREQLEVIHRNGLRLLKLVNNLLDFSRIEAGRIQPLYREIDVGRLTTELASVFRSAIERTGLRFVVDCPSLDVPVYVDREMWEKIVFNLLSNAFKFTLEGSIAVRLRAAGSRVELVVEDTGAGIPEGELDRVFERFHRVAGTRARSHEGTGIGLALVNELVRLHGGTIHVVSEPGVGSAFTVSIPTGSSHLPAHQVGGDAGADAKVSQPEVFLEEAESWGREGGWMAPVRSLPGAARRPWGRVLIADDNADMRNYLYRLLAPEYEVEVVSNGAEVLAALERAPLPDLVLTDVMMPMLDGFELLARLRENPRTRTLPVLVLSARAGEEARVEGLQAGADDYLVKPFSARELTAKVRSQIAIARTRRAAELTIRAAEERLRLALEVSRLGTFIFDMGTGELVWDARHKEMFGYTPDAEITIPMVLDRIHPEDRDRIREEITSALGVHNEQEYRWEYRVLLPDGTVKSIEANGKTILDQSGGNAEPSIRLVGTVRDVTEEKRAEEAFRETQKLESLGLLAGGIAHDFNNLLTGVIGNASLLAEEFPPHTPQAEIAAGLMEAAQRMARLTSQMLAYSGRGHFVIESVNLSDQVLQIISLVQASIPKNVRLRLSLAEDLPLVEADVSQLQQVIMNVVINGAEAVGNNAGQVELTTGVQDVAEEELSANVTRQPAKPGRYVVLTIADTGCGMDEATRTRIFDPFFTTKFTGRGLGLSSVLGIVRGHKALLTVDSRPGAGTTFRIFFPLAEHQGSPQRDVPAIGRGQGTILVVDDEEVVRRIARTSLERLGYAVLTAVNGQEALRLYREAHGAINVVLLDMTMPVIGGEEALQRLLEIDPEVQVLAMSGFDEGEAKSRFGAGIAGFLQKPFTAAQLGAKVATVRQSKPSR